MRMDIKKRTDLNLLKLLNNFSISLDHFQRQIPQKKNLHIESNLGPSAQHLVSSFNLYNFNVIYINFKKSIRFYK